jgi:cell division protein FtsB
VKNARIRRQGSITALPRRRRRSFGLPKLVAVAGAILACYLLSVIAMQSIQYFRLRQQLHEYEARIAEHETRNEAVGAEIERLYDFSYIELLARKFFGLVKPGETVFQLED